MKQSVHTRRARRARQVVDVCVHRVGATKAKQRETPWAYQGGRVSSRRRSEIRTRWHDSTQHWRWISSRVVVTAHGRHRYAGTQDCVPIR